MDVAIIFFKRPAFTIFIAVSLNLSMQQNAESYQLFRKVFFEQYKPLCQYALTMVKEPDTCEDIVQDIMLKVWEKKQALLGKEEIRFYLFAAVRNNCLTVLAKKKKLVMVELTGHEKHSHDEESGANATAHTDTNALVEEALSKLPPKCREVFMMSRISKLTYREIADALSISVKTVENQMGKALGIIRQFIKERWVNYFILGLFLIYGIGEVGVNQQLQL